MTRISLTEDYDDRNVISKLKNMNDKLDSALVDTQEAVTSAREASANAQTASDAARASAHSASESAEIVAGYDSRLDTAEQEISDVKDYAEAIGDDVSAIDTEIHTTRPYMTTNTEQTITAKKHIPTATVNDDSDVAVNKAFVQATDGRNNLIHNIASETIRGQKTFVGNIIQRLEGDAVTTRPTVNYYRGILQNDENDVRALELYRGHYTNGQTDFYITLRGENNAVARIHFVLNANGGGSVYVQQPDPSKPNIILASWTAYTPQ